MQALPKISIVTPSYNQGQYLEKTILSVLDQNYPNLEYIIIDGGSSDNSVEIIKKYKKNLKYWVSEPDRGQSHAINKGLEHATGQLLTWLNSDDYLKKGALDKFAEIYQQGHDAGVIVGAGQIVDPSAKVIYHKEPTAQITIESLYNWMNGGDFMQPSSVFYRKAWEKCGPLDENIHIAFDLDFWLRIAENNFEFISTDDLLSEALSHDTAKTTAFRDLMLVDAAVVIIKHGGEHAVKNKLDQMAQRLSFYETNYNMIMDNVVVKFALPFVRKVVKPAIKWNDTIPAWLRH